MDTSTPSTHAFGRILNQLAAMVLAASLVGVASTGALAASPSPSPGTTAAAKSTETLAEVTCQSLADLQLIVEFLRDSDASEDGWLPILVGAIAGLAEAHRLVGLVSETYGPLLDDLTSSLQGLRTTAEDLGSLGTTGARIAAVGRAITGVGEALDALSVQLQTRCPTASPAASPEATGPTG